MMRTERLELRRGDLVDELHLGGPGEQANCRRCRDVGE